MSNWLFFNCPKCKVLYHLVKAQAGPSPSTARSGVATVANRFPAAKGSTF